MEVTSGSTWRPNVISLLYSWDCHSCFPSQCFHFTLKTLIFGHFPSFTDLLLWLLQYLVCYKMCHNVCYYKNLTYINMPKCFAQRSRCKRATSSQSCSFLLVYLAFFFPVFAPQIIQIYIIDAEQPAQMTQNTEGNERFTCKQNFLVSCLLIGINLELGYGGLLQSGGSGMDSRLCECHVGLACAPNASFLRYWFLPTVQNK